MNAIEVRVGLEKDLKSLLELIQELADYENASEEVEVTLETLKKDFNQENPAFEFLVAEENEQILGVALFYPVYSTWKGKCLFLEDLVVKETARRKGIGSLLLRRLIEESKSRKAKRLEWQVLDWNHPAIEFYKKYQAIFDSEWINCKLEFN